MTAKSRQFVVDASHSDAISLVPVSLMFPSTGMGVGDATSGDWIIEDAAAATPRGISGSLPPSPVGAGPAGVESIVGVPTAASVASVAESIVPLFEPFPEILQSIVSLRCRFEEDRSIASKADALSGTVAPAIQNSIQI